MKNLSAFILSFALFVLCLGNIPVPAEDQTSQPATSLHQSNIPWSAITSDIKQLGAGKESIRVDWISMHQADVFDAVNKMADFVIPDVRMRPDPSAKGILLISANTELAEKAKTLLQKIDENPSIDPNSLAALAQAAPAAAPAVPSAPPLASQNEMQTRIFKLANSQAQMITQVLQQIAPNARIIPDVRSNSVIVSGNEEELQQIEHLLQNLDVSIGDPPQTASSNLAYRVYAIEIPLEISSDTLLRQDFDAEFRIPGNAIFSSLSQLKSSLDSDIAISDMQCSYVDKNVDNPEPFSRLRITGSLTSADKFQKLIDQVKKIVNKEVEVTVSDLQFRAAQDFKVDRQTGFDNQFYGKLQETLNAPDYASTEKTSLRAVKKALNNLLGENLLVRGYWFGNSSLPGECSAPIGEWKLELNAFEPEPSQIPGEGMSMGMGGMGMGGMGMGMSGMMGGMSGMGGMGGGMMGAPGTGENANRPRNPEFKMEIHLMAGDTPILSNTVNARIGRPVIVGYSRKIGDNFIPGALVVIPETDFLELDN